MNELDRRDDEALSALIDGSLPSEEVGALRARLAREPTLAARLAAMERADRAVRDAYRNVVDEPMPERVLDLLRAPRADDGRVGRVTDLRAGRRRVSRTWFPPALAAGIALAVGVAIGLVSSQWAGDEGPTRLLAATGTVSPGTPLHELLESAPSGVARPLFGAATAEARFTFRAQGGDWCRELAISTAAASNTAIACRRAGAWRLELIGVASANGELYRPAGAGAPFQEAVDALIDGEPLEPAAERELLESGWSD